MRILFHVTLNLMLTCRDAVYLSGDFRLTSPEDRQPLPDCYDTQKLIPVLRRQWAALVAYSGVASAPPLIRDVGAWAATQVEAIPDESDPELLADRLLGANSWLSRIRGDARLAFSIVGFSQQRPFMMLLSNFLDLRGRTRPATPLLSAYRQTPDQPEVRAVGVRLDISERARLRRLLQAKPQRRSIRELTCKTMAEINSAAAGRSSWVSEACVCGYLLRSGVAEITAHGIPKGVQNIPGWIQRAIQECARSDIR